MSYVENQLGLYLALTCASSGARAEQQRGLQMPSSELVEIPSGGRHHP